MRIIKYEIKDDQFITPCPYKADAKVGSAFCAFNCKCETDDTGKRIIYCSYEEKPLTEDKPMYELLKKITLQAILDAGAQWTCQTFQSFHSKAFAAGYGPNDEIPLEKALEWRKTDFLFEKGFIRKKEEDINYALPVFAECNEDGELCRYLLITMNNGYAWLRIDSEEIYLNSGKEPKWKSPQEAVKAYSGKKIYNPECLRKA